MNAATLELALKKQRLQIANESLRAEFGDRAAGLKPVFTGADCAVEGVRWVRHHPELAVATVVAVIVIRPRSAWRWARRAFIAWQAWQKLRDLAERRQSPFRQW